MFQSFAQSAASFAAKFPFDNLVWLAWGTYAAIFILAFTLSFAVPAFRAASKRPFLCLSCAYTAITFSVFLTVNTIEQAAFAASLFWVVGYILYGVLCLIPKETKERRAPYQVAVSAVPALPPAAPAPAIAERAIKTPPPRSAPAGIMKNNVRLEHAIAVTDKLLAKNLGKTDRQELEKLKNTLEVMKVKGNLSPAEGEILNENFNTLLKLMAKYNV